MTKASLLLTLTGFLGCLVPTAAAIADEPISCAVLQQMLTQGNSAQSVVEATTQSGSALAEATVHAMNCVGGDQPAAIAAAGIAQAENLAEARRVADAVLASAGSTGPVADAVQVALQDYIRYMPQPDVYEDNYTPTGGSDAVSPAA